MDFRFGVITGRARTGEEWAATARRAEELGYDTLLIPDTRRTYAPFPALAVAAAHTRTLRVGTYVLSAPNRTPGLVAWDSETLQALSGGRFELGLGGGRPGAEADAAALGADFGTPGDRLRRVAETIDAVRATAEPPRILVAASKPKMFALAADRADTIALGLPPAATEADIAAVVAGLDRPGVELHLNTAAVAPAIDAIDDRVSMQVGGDAKALAAAGAASFLIGSPEQIAATLRRRRDELGISYIGVSGLDMERFAEVIPRLRPAG
jgi:alkanesulfonate monooxygenase SsuD/methylene tetrahydromethanopterin reductase-like flavin-dependent oxidoreductase (luciferase family)